METIEVVGEENKDVESTIFPMGLEPSEFRKAAHKLIDIIIDYHKTLQDGRPALPDVKPGFMRHRLPSEGPEKKETWSNVFEDIENIVFDGTMHWLSSNYYGYFTTGISYPSLLGELLCDATAAIGFSWASSPSCTELETVIMDWLAKALDLPKCFIHDGKGPGGGVIQASASEVTVLTLLVARSKKIQEELTRDPNQSIHQITERLVAYSSKCSHSSVEKAGRIALITMRPLDFDENISLRGDTLRQAIKEDRENGKIPLYVCATLGTTSCCSYDNLEELGPICKDENIWLHVDAAYAGGALICPEFRYIAKGLQYVTSFNCNPHKTLLVNFDCSALWVRNGLDMVNAFNVDPVYLQHEQQSQTIDYRHWQIPLGRRFRSIKLWFVMRMIGIEGLREHVRMRARHAKHFENLVRSDKRFEIVFPVTLGLVCFRLVGTNSKLDTINALNIRLHDGIRKRRQVCMVASTVNDTYFLRFSAGMNFSNIKDIENCWKHILDITELTLKD